MDKKAEKKEAGPPSRKPEKRSPLLGFNTGTMPRKREYFLPHRGVCGYRKGKRE